jgi:chromosome segregation and condensation protein ScpB
MGKRWCLQAVVALVLVVSGSKVSAEEQLRLVGNQVETFINDNQQASRLTALIETALKDRPLTITATTQAWFT